jgi:hypothetical protein
MPQVRHSSSQLIATTTPAANFTTNPIESGLIDHAMLYVAFTVGSLTNYAIKPQFSIDGATWFNVYDTNLTQIIYTWTVTFNGAFALGSNNTAARMQPLAICVPLLRFNGTLSGTTTSSSIAADATFFTLGGGQE